MRGVAPVIAIVLFAMLAAVLAARVFAPGILSTGGEQARLVYLVGWLAMLSVALLAFNRMGLGHALRSLLIWAVIGLFLVAIYALRDDFRDLYAEVAGEIAPAMPQTVQDLPPEGADSATQGAAGSGSASVRRAADGHFYADAQVDGARVRFLVDTGASTVALTRADARRAGVDVNSLRYTMQINTANGVTRGALVRLDRIAVGGVRLENVDAVVIEGDVLPISLLGMSFLGRLSRYEATQETLILRR